MKFLLFLLLATGALALLSAPIILAAETGNAPHCSIYQNAGINDAGLFNEVKCACVVNGDCSLNDLFRVAFNGSEFIVGISASLALLFFIIGGALLLISGGNQNKIDQGKRMIRAAVIGLVIIFVAWTIVSLLVAALTGNPNGTIFGDRVWFNL